MENQMIKLTDNRVALIHLGTTIKAIDQLDELILIYSESKPGPAYVTFEYLDRPMSAQIDRSIMLVALNAQLDKLVEYMASLGIEVGDANS